MDVCRPRRRDSFRLIFLHLVVDEGEKNVDATRDDRVDARRNGATMGRGAEDEYARIDGREARVVGSGYAAGLGIKICDDAGGYAR